MKKFNIGGVVLANIQFYGIEANDEKEAINKLKKLFASNDFVDWSEWQNIEVTESIE